MSQAVTSTSTKEMALTSSNTRSFTTVGASALGNKHATNPLNSTFGSTNKAWGTDDIWGSGNGVFINGFGTGAVSRDDSASRGSINSNGKSEVEPIEAKKGSGSLVDSSVSDDWSYRTTWGSKRSLQSGRAVSHAAQPDTTTSQQRSVSTAGLVPPFGGATQALSSFAARPPPVNLNTTSAQSKPTYASAFYGSLSRAAEQPPNVYTKFDRPADPHARKLPDSAKAGLRQDQSPVEERNGMFAVHPGSRVSLPGSRNGSQPPPSQHSDDRSFFPRADYSLSTQRQSYTNSRTPSLSSQGNSFQGSYAASNADQISYQLGQLSVNGDSRPSTSHKPTLSSNTVFSQTNALFAPSFSPSGVNGVRALGVNDDAEDAKRLNFDYGWFPTLHSQEYSNYSTPTSFGPGMQPPTKAHQGEQRQSYANGHVATSRWDQPPVPRASSNWLDSGNGLTISNRSPPVASSQQAYLDQSMQQLQNSLLRNPYAPLYGPFGLPNGLLLGSGNPFIPFIPHDLVNLGPMGSVPDASSGESVQSSIMYKFKTDPKAKHWEIKEIFGHIPEFSGDQHGSRFIQNRLESANSDEKEHVFREIEPNAIPLMTDVFGNYVIQKFFEHGDQTHKKILANKMRGQVLSLSLQMYGCRVVQKALEHVLVDQQSSLVRELEGQVIRCVKDQNGNHVIQKAIERCPPSSIDFIFQAFRGQVQGLSIHPYGCRVIQRCLERCEPLSKARIMHELIDGIQQMVSDQYGNYVVQHVVEHDDGDAKRHVLNIVARGLESYSKHKFASNVVEKCLAMADDDWRRHVVLTLATGDSRRCEGEGALVGLIKDNFGNYVIQKLLDTLSPEDYAYFLEFLQPAMAQVKRTGCGKQVLSIEKKMQRFPPQFRNTLGNNNHNNMVSQFNAAAAVYQLGLPTPPFASHFNSAATTPPPLTADTSRQSSALQSINGDAVEGAAAVGNGKMGHVSMDGHFMR